MKAQGELQRSFTDYFRNYLTTRLELSQLSTRIKNLSFKMRPSMCQKSLDACIIFYYNYLFSLLGSSPSFTFVEKKRERENGIYLSF